jgi:predicted heme/steroid binding protein
MTNIKKNLNFKSNYICKFKDTSYSRIEMLPKYSKSQLALRNGQDKPEIWVAYKGKIYDVSDSRLWRNGKHYEHWAGQDLTDELKDAPHTQSVFEKFEQVGILAEL